MLSFSLKCRVRSFRNFMICIVLEMYGSKRLTFENCRQFVPKMAQVESQVTGVHEEGDDFYQDIEMLQSHGINVADIKKLKTAGICTVRGIQMITKKKLCAIKGLSEAKVEKMKEAVLKICGSNAGFCTALQHSLNRRNVFRVGTGSQVSHNMFLR